MKNKREEAIDKAIHFIKNCAYKGTAIKIELEGQLNREGGTYRCRMCEGRGNVTHPCKSDNCEDCGNRGIVDCTECNGNGNGPIARKRMSTNDVHQYLMDHVSAEAVNALVFAKTYNDGSVDTEFTFTLLLDDVRYSVEFIRAFKSLEHEIGTQLHTSGAGMHVAILNSPSGNYPGGNHLDSRRAANFTYTMTKLLPALYFLASPSYASRRLGYRPPKITMTDKYGAVSGLHCCFEYRIFETCYERPEAILDNLCVIANSLKYYHYRKIELPFFGKIGKVGFSDYGQGLSRFFDSEPNYKALMEGVRVLKPSYKTIAELRKERNFKLTLTSIKKDESMQEKMFASEYRTKRDFVEKAHSNLIAEANKQLPIAEKEYTQAGYPFEKSQWLEDFFDARGLEYPQGTLKDYIKKKKELNLGDRAYSEITI